MATPHAPLPSSEAVEAAISKVLAAEREARESVLACRRHAEELIEAAHQEARLISERCERRMQAVRQCHARALAHRLAALQDDARQFKTNSAPTPEALARLRHAVAAVADECTGNTP